VCSLGEKKSRSLQLESANYAKTGEQSVFSEIHTMHAFGTPQGTPQFRLANEVYVAVRVVTDTQKDYRNPFGACAPRVN
jgi:hypothetical protein